MATKFYLCPTCGNVIMKLEDGGATPQCCGSEMVELRPRTTDSLVDKHVPVFERLDEFTVKVKIGNELHPMEKEHHINFIWLETAHGGQLRYLFGHCASACSSRSIPSATFYSCNDPVVAVYAYCNIHGLWKLDVNEI